MGASRSTWIRAAVLLGIVLCSGCASPGSEPRLSRDEKAEALSHFSLGLLAENSGEFEIALGHLKEAIRIDPDETVLYPLAVSTALRIDQPDEALRLARQLRKHRPERLAPRLLEAQVCALTKRTEEAEALFRQAASVFPEETDGLLSLARFLILHDKKQEAIRTLESARAVHADHTDILSLLGTLYIDQAKNSNTRAETERSLLDGIALLEKALARNPDNSQQWQQIGYAHLALNDNGKAQTAFEKANELLPVDIQTARQLLDVYILNSTFDRALNLCAEIARHTGTDPELWLQYLIEQTPAEHADKLTGQLETYLEKHPYAPVLYYARLGSLYLDQQKLQEAESVLQKAQQMYPENIRVQIVIGYLHLQQKRYEEAYSTLNQLRAGSPDADWTTPFFTFNFMLAAQKSGHLEEAAEVLASSYTKDPESLSRYMQALLTGRTPVSADSAIDLLNAFHVLAPEAAETLYYLSLLQADQEKYEEALGNARQYETLVSGGTGTNLLDGFFYYQYGVLHERTGNLDKAETFFRKAIEMGPPATAASAQNYIAYMWTERGEKLGMALELIQQALTAEPDNAAYIDTLGWIYYMMERYEEALIHLQKASELISDDPVVWEHLGDTHLKLGDTQAAIQHWEKGLEINPDQDSLIQRLKQNGISPDSSPVQEDIPADTPNHP